MQIVIDIPENDYELALRNDYSTINQGGSYWRGSIKRPIAWLPLPEGYNAEV